MRVEEHVRTIERQAAKIVSLLEQLSILTHLAQVELQALAPNNAGIPAVREWSNGDLASH